jgi:hypothetical protein
MEEFVVVVELASAARLAEGIDGIVTRLLRRSTRLVPDDVPALIVREITEGGFGQAAICLADLDQRWLTPVPPEPGLGLQDIDATIAGRAFQLERPMVFAKADGCFVVWMPLVDGSERFGVLYLECPATSEELLLRLDDLAAVVSALIVAKAKYGDAFVLARRRQEMTLAAELRWSMLPPLTFAGEDVGIACVLEPAYEVAGDAFDYALNDGVLHFAVLDAMGHGLEASRLANLALGAYRAARRRGLDLRGTYHLMDAAVRDQFGDEHFVTAQLATLDARNGVVRWVNAGHPHPLLLRGRRVSSELLSEPALPLGLGGNPSSIAEVALEPTDALLFFTDGIVEAGSPGGERFGTARLLDLTRRALADEQTLAETLRRLARAVRTHRDGPLADDATILCVDWHPRR